jgi:hypothetical protein
MEVRHHLLRGVVQFFSEERRSFVFVQSKKARVGPKTHL